MAPFEAVVIVEAQILAVVIVPGQLHPDTVEHLGETLEVNRFGIGDHAVEIEYQSVHCHYLVKCSRLSSGRRFYSRGEKFARLRANLALQPSVTNSVP